MRSLFPQLMATLGGSIVFLIQLLISILATFGAFSLGTVIAWSSSALPKIEEEIVLGDAKNWVVSVVMIGAAIVPWVAAISFKIIGKKWSLIALSLPFISGWILLCLASSPLTFIIGRFLTGFAGGAFVLAAPAYSAEICETKYRGALGTVMCLMCGLGILFINLNCNTDWRVLSGVCITFPALMALWMIFMPSSPVFLVSKGDLEGAKKSLQWLRARKEVAEELEELQDSFGVRELVERPTVWELFSRPEYTKPLAIVLVLMALQQVSGANYVLSYSVIIFKSSGAGLDACLSAMLCGLTQVIGTFFSTILIEKYGRKVLLLISELSTCLSMLGVGIFFFLYERCEECQTGLSPSSEGETLMVSQELIENIGFLPLICLMIFIAMFSLGLGPIPWILNVELIPPEAQAVSSSLCTTFNWLMAFLVAQFIPSLGNLIGSSSCYFLFSGLALLGSAFIYLALPETKGRKEEEIREYFSKIK